MQDEGGYSISGYIDQGSPEDVFGGIMKFQSVKLLHLYLTNLIVFQIEGWFPPPITAALSSGSRLRRDPDLQVLHDFRLSLERL